MNANKLKTGDMIQCRDPDDLADLNEELCLGGTRRSSNTNGTDKKGTGW